MQVQLKQREIEESVKGYLIQQGINLTGKAVTVGFTAGRSDRGLTAEIDIEDRVYVGYASERPPYPPLQPVPLTNTMPCDAFAQVQIVEAADSGQAAQGANPGDPEPVTVEADPAPVAKTTSLFG